MPEFNKVQGKNMLYKALQQASIIVGILVVIILMLLNYADMSAAQTEVYMHYYYHATKVMVPDTSPGAEPDAMVWNEEYCYPNLHLPTEDQYHQYVWNGNEDDKIGWVRRLFPTVGTAIWQMWRLLTRGVTAGKCDQQGWAITIVERIALRRFWMVATVIAAAIIYSVCAKKLRKMRQDYVEHKDIGVIVEDYAKMCDWRLVRHIAVMAIAVVLSIKLSAIWLALAAIVVLLAEIIYFYKFAARTDDFNTGSKKSKFATVFTWSIWVTMPRGVQNFVVEKVFVFFDMIRRLPWPHKFFLRLYRDSQEEYHRRFEAAQEPTEEDEDES